MAPHSSTLAWKIPWMKEPGGLQSMGSRRVRHDWATSLSLFTFMHWRRQWQPTPVFLPGESQGRGSPGGLLSMGSHRVGHDWATSLSIFTFHFHALEKEMATHSSVLAWRIPGMREPGGLPSMGSHRVRYDWSDVAAAAAAAYYSFTHLSSIFKTDDCHYCSVAQSCLVLCDLMDCSLPGSSVHGIF